MQTRGQSCVIAALQISQGGMYGNRRETRRGCSKRSRVSLGTISSLKMTCGCVRTALVHYGARAPSLSTPPLALSRPSPLFLSPSLSPSLSRSLSLSSTFLPSFFPSFARCSLHALCSSLPSSLNCAHLPPHLSHRPLAPLPRHSYITDKLALYDPDWLAVRLSFGLNGILLQVRVFFSL